MNLVEGLTIAYSIGLTAYVAKIHYKINKADNLISEETRRKIAHTEAFEELTNPDKILEEFEANAVASEALRAKRNLKIRDDAGPHARIYKPPLRSVQPRSDRQKVLENMAKQVDTEVPND